MLEFLEVRVPLDQMVLDLLQPTEEIIVCLVLLEILRSLQERLPSHMMGMGCLEASILLVEVQLSTASEVEVEVEVEVEGQLSVALELEVEVGREVDLEVEMDVEVDHLILNFPQTTKTDRDRSTEESCGLIKKNNFIHNFFYRNNFLWEQWKQAIIFQSRQESFFKFCIFR